MSDELEDWEDLGTWGLKKEIGSHSFHIIESDGRFYLRIPGQSLATRARLEACQHLAHATARLWAGDNE